VYERPTAPPVFWQMGSKGRPVDPGVEGIDWSSNEVVVRFIKPVSGRVMFAQTSYPGFRATADGVPVSVQSHGYLMSVDLLAPARELRVYYQPDWLIPSMTVAVMGVLGAFATMWWGLSR